MTKLTERQKEVVAAIRRHIEAKGYPPTYRELCARLGCASTYAIACHLRAIEAKGAIEIDPRVSRGIRVVSP